LAIAPSDEPLNITPNVQSAFNFMLSWTPPSLENQNGLLVQYHVIIMETQILYLDNGTVMSQMGVNRNRTYNVSEGRTQLIDMLHPSYNYTVRIAAATVVGIGPFSDPITVMTLEDGECMSVCILYFVLCTTKIPTRFDYNNSLLCRVGINSVLEDQGHGDPLVTSN